MRDDDNPIEEKKVQEPRSDDKAIVVADRLLPGILPIILLTDRPMFPKMMHPIMVVDDKLIEMITAAPKSTSNYIGLVLMRPEKGPSPSFSVQTPEDLHKIGVVAKIVQISPPVPNEPLPVMVQILERMEIIELLSENPPFRAKIKYLYEVKADITDELKAYAVSIINAIKELVELKPLFKEQLTLLTSQININEPGALADFSASLTTASGEELQKILETKSIRTRVEKTLILLKKEIEISKLQTQINKRIEERLSAQQREFFLKQQ